MGGILAIVFRNYFKKYKRTGHVPFFKTYPTNYYLQKLTRTLPLIPFKSLLTMDFAEFSGIDAHQLFSFRYDLEMEIMRVVIDEVNKDRDEMKTSEHLVRGVWPLGDSIANSSIGRKVLGIKTAGLVEKLHRGIMGKFNEIYNPLEKMIKNRFDSYEKELLGKDIEFAKLKGKIETMEFGYKLEIESLNNKIKYLKNVPRVENELIAEVLELNPIINTVIDLNCYSIDTSLALSKDQNIIARLLFEIYRIKNELRMSNSKNLSLKNKLALLFKNYYDDFITNKKIDEVKQECKEVKEEYKVLEGLSFEAQLRIDTLIAENEQLRAHIANNQSSKPENIFSDIVSCITFFKGINVKQLILIATLVISIINFVNCLSARTMLKKFFGFVLIPIIYALIYILIKDYNRN